MLLDREKLDGGCTDIGQANTTTTGEITLQISCRCSTGNRCLNFDCGLQQRQRSVPRLRHDTDISLLAVAGVPMAVGAAALFGAAAPLRSCAGGGRAAAARGLFYLGAGIGLAAVHFGRAAFGIPAPEAPLRAGDLPWLAAVVVFGGVLGPLS